MLTFCSLTFHVAQDAYKTFLKGEGKRQLDLFHKKNPHAGNQEALAAVAAIWKECPSNPKNMPTAAAAAPAAKAAAAAAARAAAAAKDESDSDDER